jgi:hypothetical protein
MATVFVPNSSRKELFTKFITTVLVSTSSKIITKSFFFLNEWNEHVAEVKLEDFCTNYFAKQKRHQAE